MDSWSGFSEGDTEMLQWSNLFSIPLTGSPKNYIKKKYTFQKDVITIPFFYKAFEINPQFFLEENNNR